MTVKVWTFVFSTLLLVTGCSKSEVVTSYEQVSAGNEYTKQPTQQEVNNSPVPVVFDAFSSQAATTRAITTTSDLETSAGFGVFGYYTHQGSWTDGSDGVTTDGFFHYTGDATSYPFQVTSPNFMYNQKVQYASSWGYTPLKYWPNDFVAGDVDDQSPAAQGSMTSKLSFFAYAPWVATASQIDATSIEGATTGNSTGIVGFSGNAYTGDPYIIYNQSSDAGDDDLLYAYNKNINLTKPSIGSAISFEFKPALARLDLTVRGLYDETSSSSNTISTNNHDINDYINFIKVESVSIRPYYLNALSEKVWITRKGRLNLNTGKWELSTGVQAELGVNYSSSIVDNLKYNPKENKSIQYGVGRYYGVAGKTNNDPIPPSDATNINQELIKSGKNLFFIPFDDGNTQQLHLKVSIKYHVYTLDARMKDGWSHIVNEVESVDAEDVVITPQAGNTYTLQLVLGMTTVQMRVKDKDSAADDERDWWNLHPETSPSSGEHQIPYNP